jgi:Flp pilus assembly protein TadD
MWIVMRIIVRILIASACLVVLAGCETVSKNASLAPGQNDPAAPSADATVTGTTVTPSAPNPDVADTLLGGDPYDDLNLGKRHYREQNYGLAEKHFRRAVEKLPRDGEAWLGLAASYDRLRRFDLADRAYAEAQRLVGPTVEILNDEGFSYMLRGDYARAHKLLERAQARDPANPNVQANMQLLEDAYHEGKAIQ